MWCEFSHREHSCFKPNPFSNIYLNKRRIICRIFRIQASADSSWFKDMSWTICLCKQCSQHLGWLDTQFVQILVFLHSRYFQPEEPNALEAKQRSFVGLVLDYLISADYVDTLTKLPNA